MKKANEKELIVTIKYNSSENPEIWNNFIRILISFMIESNVLGEINDNEKNR